MVAIIHNSKSLRNALHYNENKVRQGIAKLIHSNNYSKDTKLLGFSDKIKLLEKLTALNQQTKVNSVHVSLNFDLLDKLNVELLKEIADVYMQQIGFGAQPYLVYQHNDAGHPHIHIVTTNIQQDGKRIELHNLARNQSMKASMQIEKDFNIIKATSRSRLNYKLKPINVQRILYGRSETKRAITNVLDHVLSTYKYTSVAELNAVLQLYNVIADRGNKDSRTFQNKGLVYRILDSDGKRIGIPVKASLIYNKPTLKNIEARFELNEKERNKYKQRIINAIDFAFFKKSNLPLQEFIQTVQKERIQVVLRQNDKGLTYGITYVDHHTKCVFNGSDLGKKYSASAIQQRCGVDKKINQATKHLDQLLAHEKTNKSSNNRKQIQPDVKVNQNAAASSVIQSISTLVDDLLQPEQNQNANEPFEQKRFKKKRKQQKLHD